MDIGSAVGRDAGVSEEQLTRMASFEDSDAFDEIEKRVLRFAAALSATPATVSDELFAQLREHFDDAQLVELAAVVAWENYRSRFNRAFDIQAQGFSEGAFCVIPERASLESA
jgi:alkylhydroperoxidase family enzyme